MCKISHPLNYFFHLEEFFRRVLITSVSLLYSPTETFFTRICFWQVFRIAFVILSPGLFISIGVVKLRNRKIVKTDWRYDPCLMISRLIIIGLYLQTDNATCKRIICLMPIYFKRNLCPRLLIHSFSHGWWYRIWKLATC